MLLVLRLLSLAEKSLELLDLPLPRLHGHLLLLLSEAHLVELRLRVNVFLQEAGPLLLHYNHRWVKGRARLEIEIVPLLSVALIV